MYPYDPQSFFHFVHGNYDELFRPYRNYSEKSEYVHLAAAGKRRSWWAVAKPLTNRSGVVLWSNFLKSGSRFRTVTPLSYAKRPRRPGEIETLLDPRRLHLTFVPAPLRLVRPRPRRAAPQAA